MAQISKEWVEAYFQYGVDTANRRVFLFDDVEESTIGVVIKALYFMDSQVSVRKVKGKARKYRKPIDLFVGSFGGSDYEMYALYDVLQTLKSPVHTVAMGKCMSAAPLLVAAGHVGQRWATPNTWFMVHQGNQWMGEDTRAEIGKANVLHAEDINDRWYELMARHTKMPKAFWKKMCSKHGDTYFGAEEAVEYGIVDAMWAEKE